jgi:hypothetical protein
MLALLIDVDLAEVCITSNAMVQEMDRTRRPTPSN